VNNTQLKKKTRKKSLLIFDKYLENGKVEFLEFLEKE